MKNSITVTATHLKGLPVKNGFFCLQNLDLRHLMTHKNAAIFMLVAAMILGLASCGEDETNPPPVTNPPEATGNILVKVITVGGDEDPEGYTLTVQGVPPQELNANGEITINNRQVGRYQVELSGIASHCTGTGNLVREVNVTANGTATVEFEVSCKAILRDRIVYGKGENNFTNFKVYTAKLDGTDEKLILDQVIRYPSSLRISPDGTKIAFTDDRVGATTIQQVYVMDADGENLRMIPFVPSDTPALTSQFNPVWHSDSKKLTFRNGPKTVTYDLETQERTELEFGEGSFFGVAEVFDNGKKFLGIHFVSRPGEPSANHLATVNSDGSDLQLLKQMGEVVFSSLKIANGNTIVYLQRRNASGFNNEVWQMSLDGTEDQQIGDKMGFGSTDALQTFTLSPDSSEFLFYMTRGSGVGVNFLFAKTKVNGSPQFINFSEAALRTHVVWSPVTRE